MPGIARQPCEEAFQAAVTEASWPRIVEFGAQTQRYSWSEPFARSVFAVAPAASLAALLDMPLKQFVARSKQFRKYAPTELVRQAYWLLVWRRFVGHVKLQT